MSTSSDQRNPVELLAEEFLDRKRRGEHPTLQEYLERHPELADEIRDLFPALLMMEDLGETSGGATGSVAAGNGPLAGARIERLGDYRILREVGRGGMGVVYEAEQESLGRRVALKVLSSGALADPKQVRRFEREAKAAARLHHTNIVPVFGVGQQDGHHYFVMQFIAGLGLDMVLEDLRRLRGAKSVAKPAPEASEISGLTAADVARSLLTGRFGADGPPCDGSVTVGPRPPVLPQRRSDRHPGGRGAGVRQPSGHPPPRRQAEQPAAGQPRQRLGGRLRTGQDLGCRRPHAHRRHPGDDPLHGAGAVRRPWRRAERRLQPGADALRADRPAAGV
jgi:hypothetical protein